MFFFFNSVFWDLSKEFPSVNISIVLIFHTVGILLWDLWVLTSFINSKSDMGIAGWSRRDVSVLNLEVGDRLSGMKSAGLRGLGSYMNVSPGLSLEYTAIFGWMERFHKV